MIAHPFSQGTTTSLSAKIPVTLFGLTGYQTLRGVYSTAEGFNFDDAPQLILPPELQTKLTKQGYYFGSYAVQQFLWQDPDNAGRGWGFFGQVSASDANPNPIGNAIIVGVGGSTPTRPDDRWGVAWCDCLFSRALANGLGAFGGGLNDGRVLEACTTRRSGRTSASARRASHLAGNARLIDGAVRGRAGAARVLNKPFDVNSFSVANLKCRKSSA